MSGNKFFEWQAQPLDVADELESTATAFSVHQTQFDIETEWEEAYEMLEKDELGIEPEFESERKFNNETTPAITTSEAKENLPATQKSKEFHMQEIEELVLQYATVRKIDETLCIWNGSYYQQLNAGSFAKAARKLIPKKLQKKIPFFSRFPETYNYMMANDDLLGKFKERDIVAAKHMIVFRNGIYDAEENMLIPSNPRYPVLFKIDAEYLSDMEVRTPYMDKVINHATGNDQEVLERFYQSLGYIYSQGTEAKKFLVFGTAPDSGKSLIGDFIARTIGEENVSTISLNDFGTRFKLGNISQKTLNYNMDLSAGIVDKKAVQQLKLLTGDNKIDCEEKYAQSRTAKHHCKFLFATNHPIRLKDEDEAFYRRLLLIPFIYSVGDEDRDYQLSEKLWEERHAIATRAAHAYRELYINNFVFQESSLADAMLNEWRETSSQKYLKDFFYQNCELVSEDEDAFVPTDELFKAFQKFCNDKGRRILDKEKPQFSKQFRSTFDIPSCKRRVEGYNSPVNGYIGIRLTE